MDSIPNRTTDGVVNMNKKKLGHVPPKRKAPPEVVAYYKDRAMQKRIRKANRKQGFSNMGDPQ